jgi:hypothetical protein
LTPKPHHERSDWWGFTLSEDPAMCKPLCFIAVSLLTLTASAQEPAPNTLTPDEAKDGWKLLFDGKSTDGWRLYKGTDAGKWAAKDGLLVSGGGDLMTKDKFTNYVFSVDWKIVKGNNSGIIYRIAELGNQSWNTGLEMQIMTANPKQAKLGKNDPGALYDLFAPTSNTLKPADQWNTFKIVNKGNHIEQYVNGVKVVETDIGSDEWNAAIAKSKFKGSKLFASQPTGYIALQDHGGQCLFRNIKIKVLPDSADKK